MARHDDNRADTADPDHRDRDRLQRNETQDPPADRGARTDLRESDVEQRSSGPKPAKTSVAAAFALAFGVAAFVLVLTILFSPVALVFGIIGIVLGIVGLRMARKTGVTGKGVAIGGLVLSVLSVLIVGALAIGLTTFLNNQGAVDRLERQIDQLRDNLPDVDVPTP